MNKTKTNLRTFAAQVIYQVAVEGRSLSDSLPEIVTTLPDHRDSSFVQALCYGVCRWYHKLDAILHVLLDKPLKAKDQDIHCLLLVGLYQLTEMRVPPHAAVAETVAAASDFKKIWAKNLVNAVLRNYQRRSAELNPDSSDYSHPAWMIAKIKKAWPSEWEAILIANNQHPPFALRVNQQRITRETYLAKLKLEVMDARPIPETAQGIILDKALDVSALPGFARGDISVQDGAAQLAAELLLLEPKQLVLDACAAPGGKTAHILELQPTVRLTALDKDKKRLEAVHENLQRLHLAARCICADAGDIQSWWDGNQFDRILLDAPCSASGVIRRHPDIKLLRRESDLAALVKEQTRLLSEIWTLLKPNGLLVYATCSMFPDENSDILRSFLAKHPDAREEKIQSTWGKDCIIGKQILPGMHHMDGFYYARLRKI